METAPELDIRKYLRLLHKRRYLFLAIIFAVATLTTVVSYLMPETYEAESTVLIERNYLNLLMKDITVTPSVDDRLKTLEVTLKSKSLILKVLGHFAPSVLKKTETEKELITRQFQKRMNVKVEMNKATRRDMDMFTVSFKHPDRFFARDYVNALIQKYIEESLSISRDASSTANKFLQDQINLFKSKIDTVDEAIARLAKDKKLNAQQKIAELQKQLDELLVKYTEDHPDVLKIKSDMASLKARVQASGSDGSGSISASKQVELLRKVSALQRDRDTYQKTYEQLLATQGKSEVSSGIEVRDNSGAFNILEPAVLPLRAVSPNRVLIILLGLFGGIGCGIGTIILLDSMDKSVKDIETIKRYGYPVLAVIERLENNAAIAKKKKFDRIIYVSSGVYLIGIVGLVFFELFIRVQR